MRLGEFLNAMHRDGAPEAPTCPVRFKAIARGAHGEEYLVDCNAVLAFVDESKRDKAIDAAEAVLRRAYPDGSAPAEKRRNEVAYQVLLYALRDADQHRTQFAASVDELRAALVQPVATRLYTEYIEFVDEEFPDEVTPEQLEEMAKEAEKNSFGDLLTSYGYLTIRRALPSLAARFGRSPTQTSGAGAPA